MCILYSCDVNCCLVRPESGSDRDEYHLPLPKNSEKAFNCVLRPGIDMNAHECCACLHIWSFYRFRIIPFPAVYLLIPSLIIRGGIYWNGITKKVPNFHHPIPRTFVLTAKLNDAPWIGRGEGPLVSPEQISGTFRGNGW